MRDTEVLRALESIRAGAATADGSESRTLDFKRQGRSAADTLEEVAAACICFANAIGGVVVVGVADDARGAAAFLGTTLAPDRVRQRVFELTRPGLTVDVVRTVIEGRDLLLVYVPQSAEIHSDTQGRATKRLDNTCVPLTPQDQTRLREERHGIDWSEQPSTREIRDIAPLALAVARERLARLLDARRDIARLGDIDLLRALKVITADARLTRAGEVLFCPPRELGPSIVYQHRTTPGGEARAVERLDGPLLLTFDRALELVRARSNTTLLTLPDGQQLQLEDFPELAVREAIANALLHRDYHVAGPVTVEHSPEVLVVSSPGPLVGGITPENILTHPSSPRNPLLTSAARVLGLAEEIGRGVDRMYREMIRSGRDTPRIESTADRVRVALVGGAPNTQIARLIAGLPENERDDTDTMLVLFHLRTARHVDAKALAPRLQKSEAEAETILRRLAHDAVGLVEPTRQSARRAHPSYRLRGEILRVLGSAVAYHRRTVDDLDRKMVAHVQEYGRVTNRTLQNLLDVGLHRARDLLADWVQRGLLVKTSTHERGPGVEYGPGPSFPAGRRRKAQQLEPDAPPEPELPFVRRPRKRR